jgi:uncharacterized protein with FMN-binding domain
VRITTKLATGLMGIGVLAVSYKVGLPATASTPLAASGTTLTTLTGDDETTPQPSTSAPAPAPSASSSAKPSTKPSSKPKASTTPKTPTPKKTKTPLTSSGGNTGTTTTPTTTVGGTKTGALIQEPNWGGYVQVSVTKDSSGKITAVNLVQALATGGRQGAFSVLQSAALSAQGSNFGNVSRATYTTNAFKQALDSALAKF